MGKANKRQRGGLQRRRRDVRRGIQLRKRISQPKITTTVVFVKKKGNPTNNTGLVLLVKIT